MVQGFGFSMKIRGFTDVVDLIEAAPREGDWTATRGDREVRFGARWVHGERGVLGLMDDDIIESHNRQSES
jgi:hypothetical protein